MNWQNIRLNIYWKYTNPANGILDFCWSKSSGPSYSAKEITNTHYQNHKSSLLGGLHERL